VLPKRRALNLRETSVVKSNNASDDASIPAYEFPQGIGGASPRAIIVLLTNICIRQLENARFSYNSAKAQEQPELYL
jgi:hypothetical protein